jgi:hypothetical protein
MSGILYYADEEPCILQRRRNEEYQEMEFSVIAAKYMKLVTACCDVSGMCLAGVLGGN